MSKTPKTDWKPKQKQPWQISQEQQQFGRFTQALKMLGEIWTKNSKDKIKWPT